MLKLILDYAGSIRILLSVLIVLFHGIFYSINPNNLILSSGLESCFDVLTVIFVSVCSYFAEKPADNNHPYGHYKFENLGSLFLGMLIILPTYDIFRSNIIDIWTHKIPDISNLDIILGMLALLPTLGLIGIEKLEIRNTSSELSKMNYIHFIGDLSKIFSIFLGVVLTNYFHIWWSSYVLSMGIMIVVMVSLIPNIIENIHSLTDHEADEEVYDIINKITSGYNISNLKTRTSGPLVFIDFDIDLNDDISISDSKIITSTLESNIKNSIPNSKIFIKVK